MENVKVARVMTKKKLLIPACTCMLIDVAVMHQSIEKAVQNIFMVFICH